MGTVVARTDILQAIAKVPRLPVAGVEALRALQEPDYKVNVLVAAIERDPGLTMNVLRLANSALFGAAQSIGTIKQAVMRLGAQRVGQLITASVLGPIARPAVRGYDLPPEALWRHSLAVVIGVEKLAQALDLKPPGYTTTAALLHDVGKILLGTFANIDARPILEVALAEQIPFDEAERQVLGIDHAEAGAVLMESWQLPRPLCSIVRWHHQPERCADEATAVDLVHLADAMSLTSGIGTGCDGLNYTASAAVVKRLALTQRILERVMSEVVDELENRYPVSPDGVR